MAGSQQKAGSAYLVIRQGSRWSDVFRLQPDQRLLIGRSSQCAIVVPDDRSSRQHAEIFCDAGKWHVRDLGSRNGTTVDGKIIDGPHRLEPGQTIQVAACRVSFADSLKSAFPESADPKDPVSPQSDQATQAIDGLAAITHQSQPDKWAADMAFEIAQQANWEAACEAGLAGLLEKLQIQAGGILRATSEASDSASKAHPPKLTILSAHERPGKAYHRISDYLWQTVIADQKGLLARNIQNDVALGDSQNSQSQTTTSIVAVPILAGESFIGLIHLYTRDDEPMLKPPALDLVMVISQLLAAAHVHFERQRRIVKKLNQSQQAVVRLREQLSDHQRQFEMIGQSPAMLRLEAQITRIATTNSAVLLRGESGVGKELAARQIHRQSKRADGPFIPINCGALTQTLLESELFGHEKGAFTGATDRKLGKFELADRGTLMLDEVGEMSPEIQVKFLRVLEGQAFERVGGSKPITVNVRVIAATNRDLENAVKAGTFRADLYFRLRVVELGLPSLRERPEDILPLAHHFLDQFRQAAGQGPIGFSPQAQAELLRYDWPGNIRELRNSVERAHVLASGDFAEPEDLSLSSLGGMSHIEPATDTTNSRASIGLHDRPYQPRSLDQVEHEHIMATLEFTQGQKSKAASILNIERSTLDRKLKRYETSEADD
jgi:transcriptional regulator with GAF, ATPase, and Fis domain